MFVAAHEAPRVEEKEWAMGVNLIPKKSGDVVFATISGGDAITARWTRNRVEYTGCSWGFDKWLVTWELYHRGKRLVLKGSDEDTLILDDDLDEQLIVERVPLRARRGYRKTLRILYTLSGSNHFGSAVLHMALDIDLGTRIAKKRELSYYVDIDR
jgi:hypothetical protein